MPKLRVTIFSHSSASQVVQSASISVRADATLSVPRRQTGWSFRGYDSPAQPQRKKSIDRPCYLGSYLARRRIVAT